MFHGLKYKYPWLTPPLKTDDVANAMLEILESGDNREVKLPLLSNIAPALRCLPVYINDLVKEV
jgi:hypothetical protein